ncbi:MAG: RsmB/NOP family class I SAM-dependent RNA methyltransferase [Acholeplasmataceae bacterium]
MNETLELLINNHPSKHLILDGSKIGRISSGRINTLKLDKDQFSELMNKEGINIKFVDWYENGFITEEIERIRQLDIYKNGSIYIQSLSSMLPALYLEPKAKQTILDMAAAPGGKTTLIAALTHNQAAITACEQNPIRYQKLKYNIEKQGVSNCYLIQKDARQLDDYFTFDSILLDAPCSGSGTLDLNKENKQFTKELVDKSIKVQHQLLSKAIKMLKKGQSMIYSTCSILKEENEDIVKKYLDLVEIVPITPVKDEYLQVIESDIKGVLTIAPNKYYEGFFIAKLRKK